MSSTSCFHNKAEAAFVGEELQVKHTLPLFAVGRGGVGAGHGEGRPRASCTPSPVLGTAYKGPGVDGKLRLRDAEWPVYVGGGTAPFVVTGGDVGKESQEAEALLFLQSRRRGHLLAPRQMT